MDTIIATIIGFLAFISLNSLNFSVQNFTPKAEAKSGILYAHNLIPAERVKTPYLLKGSLSFDISGVTAESATVADEETGRILFQKDATSPRPIASLTKLMSTLVWLDVDGDFDKIVEIESQDYRGGSTPYFIAGEKVRAKDLLYAALIASSNSAIASLARSTGLPEEKFVSYMNAKAKELGMENTTFTEPTGLDSGNSSTAIDLFILAREAFFNSKISKATQTQTYEFSPINKPALRIVRNTNWLLAGSLNSGEYRIAGGKTGYIEESNYNLILKIFNKEKGKNIFVVVLGSKDSGARFMEAKKLIEWTYKNYMWQI